MNISLPCRVIGLILLSFAPAVQALDFGLDPDAEIKRLERGDLVILSKIKLKSGGDMRGFLSNNRHRLKTINHLSDVYCFPRPTGNAGDGCTIEVKVHSTRVRNAEQCAMLIRWRRPLGTTAFLPESGAAKFINDDPKQFWGALSWNDSRCE